MECKLTHDTIEVNEVVFDAMVEQPIELDCLLPDYCPNVFKVLKCKMVPRMTASRITGGEVVIDGVATIFIVYICEETSHVRSFVQKVPFTKTVTLKSPCESPVAEVQMQCEYINCRGVNSRRFDLRGAVGIRLRVTDQRKETVVCNAEGSGIQKRQDSMKMDGECKQACKSFTVREELELPGGNPPVASVLYHSENTTVTDVKVIANKVIIKGDVLLHIVYCPLGEDECPQMVEYTIPMSQIIDLPGVDDRFLCNVRLEVCSAEIEPKTTMDGDSRLLSTEIFLVCICTCIQEEEKQIIRDMYSTGCGCELEQKRMNVRRTTRLPSLTSMVQVSIDTPDEEVQTIYDVWCEVARLSMKPGGNGFSLDGEFDICAICAGSSGTPLAVDKRVEFHDDIGRDVGVDDCEIEAVAQIRSVSYHVTGDKKIDLRIELSLTAYAVQIVSVPAIVNVTLDESQAVDRDQRSAVTLYFAQEGEQVWEIAKRYHTSVSAIIEENDLESEVMNEGHILLIPLAD